MDIFRKERQVLKIGRQDDIRMLEDNIRSNYNATTLKDFLSDVERSLPLIPEPFAPAKKFYYCKKEDCVRLIALIHSDVDNIRYMLANLPEYVSIAIAAVLKYGYASRTLLASLGASAAVSEERGWYHCEPAKYIQLLECPTSVSHVPREYSEPYLFLPDFLRPVYFKALLREIKAEDMFLDGPEGGRVYNAEQEFVASVPVITGLFRQDLIKCTGFKLAGSSASKIMKQLSIKEILSPAGDYKASVGQYFIPLLARALEGKEERDAAKLAKRTYELLEQIHEPSLLKALLPHVKGFKSNGLSECDPVFACSLLKNALMTNPDRWLSLEVFLEYIYSAPSGNFYGCPLSGFERMRLINSISDKTIFPDTQWLEVDMEVLKATAAAMYGLGMVEVVIDGSEKPVKTPCGRIIQMKLTALGKYVLGLTPDYKSTTVVSREWFRLDTEHLVVSSTAEDNPYEGLLAEIASPIGGGRYLIDSGSFLKKCESPEDVKKKIAFFKDYICSEPPGVWKDFFVTLQKHCQPFAGDRENYMLLKIKDSNPELVKLLTSDPQLRGLILLVEGQRFLIKAGDLSEFDKLLKSRGYLL